MTDETFYCILSDSIYDKYKKTPQRAKQYTEDVIALYKWMKGKHPSINDIAEGLNWSPQKARAIVKIARDFEVIKKYSRNTEEYQLSYRWDLTQEFKAYRWTLFRSINMQFKNMEFTDIEDLLQGDYSEANQKRVMKKAFSDAWMRARNTALWLEIFDAKMGIERDINGNIATENTPKKLLKRGSRFL